MAQYAQYWKETGNGAAYHFQFLSSIERIISAEIFTK